MPLAWPIAFELLGDRWAKNIFSVFLDLICVCARFGDCAPPPCLGISAKPWLTQSCGTGNANGILINASCPHPQRFQFL